MGYAQIAACLDRLKDNNKIKSTVCAGLLILRSLRSAGLTPHQDTAG